MIKEDINTFVGYCEAELSDDGVLFPVSIMYPTYTHEKNEKLGPFNMSLSINGEIKGGKFPLVIISHGSGGGHLLYRDLAYYLASNGFIVGMVKHPFNNRDNNTLANTVENLENRPNHINIALNWFEESKRFAKYIELDDISIIGHSMGGYTALAVAGGVPTSFPNESLDKQSKKINVVHNKKIKSLVLLAPATVWFKDNRALSDVDIPILMIVGDKDEYTPPFHAQIVLDGVADKSKVDCRIIKNAGHFSFLTQFPEFMVRPEFAPSQDPEGFDRRKFLNELNYDILNFLTRF